MKRLSRILRAEGLRITGVRAFPALVIVAVLTEIAVAVVVGLSIAASGANGYDVARPAPFVAADGLVLAQLPLIATCATIVTRDYGTGTAALSLLAVPHRGLLITAKALLATAVGAVTTVGVILVGAGVVALTAGSYGAFRPADLIAALGGAAIYGSALGCLAIGAGLLLRNTAVTVVTLIALLTVLPQLLDGVTLDWLATARDTLPAAAGAALTTAADTPWTASGATAVLVAWAAAVLAVGTHRFRRADA